MKVKLKKIWTKNIIAIGRRCWETLYIYTICIGDWIFVLIFMYRTRYFYVCSWLCSFVLLYYLCTGLWTCTRGTRVLRAASLTTTLEMTLCRRWWYIISFPHSFFIIPWLRPYVTLVLLEKVKTRKFAYFYFLCVLFSYFLFSQLLYSWHKFSIRLCLY